MLFRSGGVYGVNVSESVSLYPKPRYSIDFVWGCSPENVDKLIETVFDEAKKLKTGGPANTDLNKVKETMIRERETMLKENIYWQQSLQNIYRHGDKLLTFEEFKKMVNSIKTRDIRRTAQKYLSETNYVIGKLMPAEK